MIRPTQRCIVVVVAALPVAAVPAIVGDDVLWWPWALLLVAFALALLVEFARLPPRAAVRVESTAPTVSPFGHDVEVELAGTATRAVRCEVMLEVDGDAPPPPLVGLSLAPGATVRAKLPLRPRRRGVLRVPALHLRWTGPLGLLSLDSTIAQQLRVAVVVDVGAVRAKAARMVASSEVRASLKVERYVGDGSEFVALREFVRGMDRRSIDWKASARHREVLAREFRVERAQSVVICLDSGRLMGEPLGGTPRLDHAIRAALQLAVVSLRTGDRVGTFSFGGASQQFVPPASGMQQLQVLQGRLVELDYSDAETNFAAAMTELLRRLRRRTMLVLFTDFVDSVTAELMLRNVRHLTQRHLLLFVALRDPLLDRLVAAPPLGVDDVHRAVVADDLVRERRVVLERLRQAGAQVLDVDVDGLEAALIERYLTAKRRELL
ncbi:MAG: DUF58 domain-containing protein [Planctomycetota bacterium]